MTTLSGSGPVGSHTHTVSGKTTSRNGGQTVTVQTDVTALEARMDALVRAIDITNARIDALEAPVVVPPPVTPPPTGTVVSPGWIGPQTSGAYVLHAGTYRFGFTAAEVGTTISLMPYGDGEVIIDGTGLDPHFAYLGPGADWTIGAITIQGFAPVDSGVIGIGDGCKLTLAGTALRFPAAPMQQNRHLVYFHGTGTGDLSGVTATGAPGAALHCYRGTPKVTVAGGRFEGQYRGVLAYDGVTTINDAVVAGTGTAFDAEYKPGTLTLTRCTNATGGAVRTYVA